MSEKRFYFATVCGDEGLYDRQEEKCVISNIRSNIDLGENWKNVVGLLNEQQELIEELHISDHMGWGRAEKFEKELKQKKIYIKRLEYKVQKFKEMNYEQQDKITELEKNFDDLVKWSSEIAKRNVLLDERIGRLQQAIRIVYEKKPYPTFEDIQNEINNDI